jgi:hypothetical protein
MAKVTSYWVIDEEVRQPMVEHFEKGAGLGRVGFHIVAVEVEVGGVGAPPRHFRAVLINPVVGGPALVAIDVVDGDEDKVDMIQEALRAVFVLDQVAEQRETCVFAVHLPGVDGVLDQQDGAAGGVNCGGIEDAVLRNDNDLQVTAFAGLAEVLDFDQSGRGGGDAVKIGHGLGVIRSGPVAADLGGRAPVGGGLGKGRAGGGREQGQ